MPDVDRVLAGMQRSAHSPHWHLKTGKVHRYYNCSTKNRLGVAGCSGINIAEHTLDDAAMTAITERVLAPLHLSSLLQKLFDLVTKEEGERDAVLPALRARKAASDKALKGLYATAEAVPEAAGEKNYQQNLTNALREAKLVERALQQAGSVRAAKPVVTPQKIEAFSRSAKELLHGSNRAIAKQLLQSIVVRVEVSDETIRIIGENEQLSRLVASEGSDPEDGSDPAPGVRGYVRRWRREWETPPDLC